MNQLAIPQQDASLALILDGMTPLEREVVVKRELLRRTRTNSLARYRPNSKQKEFHALGGEEAVRERLLMAGNQLGKTLGMGFELAMHLTGRYPWWWTGRRFDAPTHWLVGSESFDLNKKGCQRILCGRDLEDNWGTGSIPQDTLLDRTRSKNGNDILDMVFVKHIGGGTSTVTFKCYEQGRKKWQADTVSGIWFDEEPPEDIYFEGMTRTNATLGPLAITFTPLNGMTKVVARYLLEKAPGTAVVTMTINDVDHYTQAQKALIIASYPAHEKLARTMGLPTMGSGRIYTHAEEDISYEQTFAIPKHWKRINGIDFGWDHPFACVFGAYDADADTIYIYDCYRRSQALPVIHAEAIKARGDWIPCAWPADGLQTEPGTGIQKAQAFRNAGCNFLIEQARMPETDAPDEETAKSRVSVEAGIMELDSRMATGRLKVSKHLNDWWEEYRLYHRKNGKVTEIRDDLMDATRYLCVMVRFAETEPKKLKHRAAMPAIGWRT